jgi:hypothetical protein
VSSLSRRRGAYTAAGLLAALALLAACSSKKEEARACPRIEIVDDLSRMVQFRDGPGRDPSDVLYAARITDAKSGCRYDNAGVTVEMTVSIRGERGRAGTKLQGGDVTYFVAIVDGVRNIIAKQPFTSRIAFNERGQGGIDDELTQRIPIKAINVLNPVPKSLDPKDQLPTAADHTIILGFQLTPDQIDFNEKSRRQ